jgi:hypothetical protein
MSNKPHGFGAKLPASDAFQLLVDERGEAVHGVGNAIAHGA